MIDSHFHLDETIVSLPGLIASMDASGIERLGLMGAVCPPVALPVFAPYLLPVLRRGLHGSGLAHAVTLAVYRNTLKKDGTVDLLGKRYPIVVQPDNDAVLAAVRRYPDRLAGYVFVNPAGPVDPIEEIERCMRVPGMIGVKAHPFWHAYPVARLVEAARLCERNGWLMLLHLGTGRSGDYRLLPESFPRLRIVYAHAGIPYSAEINRYAREKRNVYVDLSSSVYVDEPAAAKAVRAAGPDRCLFGTDGPYLHSSGDRFDFRPFVERLARLDVVEADRARIAARNFQSLTGLS